MFEDFRYGLRLMTRRPAFAALAIATLALGIGTTTAIFAVTDRVLLRPLPYPDPDRLAVIWETSPTIALPVMFASPPNLYEWQQRSKSFASMGGFQWRDVTMGGAEPERIRAARVTAGLLPSLGVQPRMGRWFLAEEDRANARPVMVISDALWRRRFHANRSIVGHTIPIDGVPTEIIGVMPPSFVCPPAVVLRGAPPSEPAELWIPHATDLNNGQRGSHYLAVIGRLAPAATIAAADREMNDIQAQIEKEDPGYKTWRALVVPLVDVVTASSRRAVGLLAAAVAFVLLLACANVANLLLARGVGRRKEFAIRTALGAGRGRLAMQVIVEVLALAMAGGVLGALLAAALIRLMVVLGPSSMPGLNSATLDLRTMLFAIAASIAAAMLAGVIPALGAMRTRLASWLTDRSGGPGAGTLRAQQTLAIAQIGVAVTLLVTAALLVESFRQLRSVDPGFRPAQVTTARLSLPASRYADGAARIRLIDQLLNNLRALPGVSSAAVIDAVPIADNRQGTTFVRLDGPAADPNASANVNVAWITDGYFESLGVPLMSGRTFTAEDTSGRDRVIIINRLLARQVFGTDDPLGRMVRVGASTQAPFQVIGVVGDEHHVGVDVDATASFFVPYRQVPNQRDLSVIVRSADTPAAAASAWSSLLGPFSSSVNEAISREATANMIRTAVRRLDPELAPFRMRTLEQVLDASVATPRSLAWLLSSFAISALLLAAIGVFGVMSHAVSQRTREIGVRVAIGASPYRMLAAILAEGLTQVGLGVMAGVMLSIVTARLLSGLLFGVSPIAVTPYLIAVAVLAVVSAIACLVPARRAMRIDPMTALRAE